MNYQLRIQLDTSAAQLQKLVALQAAFAQVCNALAPTVQQTRVWNRVALHHLAYRQLRQQFPQLGSQMVCNAIYAVSRTCRLVFQHADSPFALPRLGDAPLPLLQFADDGPVFFDRHTLSLKAGLLSLFTLDGRMRFEQALRAEDEALFHAHKLREVVLARQPEGGFVLTLWLDDAQAQEAGQQSKVERTQVELSVAQDEAALSPAPAGPVAVEAAGVFAGVAPGALPAFVQVRGALVI